MARINGQGVPTRKTAGSIGDIYSDSSTGKQYKCTFAFKSDIDGEFDHEWREIKGSGVEPRKPFPKNDIPEKKSVKTEKVEEPTPSEEVIPETVSVEEKAEKTVIPETNIPEEKPAVNNRKDYSAYSKKNN